MRNLYTALVLIVVFFTSPLFANDMDNISKSCATVAHACKSAGFAGKKSHKQFWFNCMKPVLLGQTVKGVTIDPAIVKDCRTVKIDYLKKELNELQNAS